MKMTNRTKAAATALTLALTLLLTACGHQHTWVDADCTAPKTCSECGKTEGEVGPHIWFAATCAAPQTCSVCGATEGEALPHTWQAATCTTPKTCSVCDETEGEAPGHDWQEANYQAAATCAVCGETEGEALTPDFVTYGIPLAELGETYDFIQPCYENENETTVAHVTVTDYRVFESDDTHPAKEGYEYRQAELTRVLDDKNATSYGAKGCDSTRENYYDIDDDAPFIKATGEGRTYTINYNGQEQEYTYFYPKIDTGEWEGNRGEETLTAKYVYTALVPVGYDGIVVGLYDPNTVSYDKGLHLNDVYEEGKFVLFRMA